jgi:hypothetical protein
MLRGARGRSKGAKARLFDFERTLGHLGVISGLAAFAEGRDVD